MDKVFQEILKDVLSESKIGVKFPDAAPEKLKELGARYLSRNDFKPGDIVKWKQGLRSGKYPSEQGAAVVLEVVAGNRSAFAQGSNHSFEPLEMRIGVIDTDGICEGFWVDKNRFEPVVE